MTTHTDLQRLDDISRERALTMAESAQLQRLLANRQHQGRRSVSNKIPGMNATQEPALLGNHEAAWRTDAENSNVWFVAALKRYFERGGRG